MDDPISFIHKSSNKITDSNSSDIEIIQNKYYPSILDFTVWNRRKLGIKSEILIKQHIYLVMKNRVVED